MWVGFEEAVTKLIFCTLKQLGGCGFIIDARSGTEDFPAACEQIPFLC